MSPSDPVAVVRPHVERLLEQGEAVRGAFIAVHQSTFSGHSLVIGVTDRRLIVQPLDRKMQPKGDAESIRPTDIRAASLDGAGGGWLSVNAAILDVGALVFKLTTTDGRKRKFHMMKGGAGVLGGVGGGSAQQDGIIAMSRWMEAAVASS